MFVTNQSSVNASVTATTVPTTVLSATPSPTFQPFFEHESDHGSSTLGFIFLSTGAVAIVVSALIVVLMLVRKSRLNRLRHHLMPLYNFDGTDDYQEEWEAELLDDISERHGLRRGYRSMEFKSTHDAAGL